MKHIILVVLPALLTGCWAGFSGDFSDAECEAFASRYLDLSGKNANQYLSDEDRSQMRAKTVNECKGRSLGVSREEFACAMKASSEAEFTACGIVLKG